MTYPRMKKIQFPWHIFTTTRVLNALFGLFAFLTLISGAILCAFALLWMYPDPSSTTAFIEPSQIQGFNLSHTIAFISLVLTQLDILASLVVGVILITTFFASLPAIITRGTAGLYLLNIVVALDVLGVIAGSSTMWFRSLRTRVTFWDVWQASSEGVRGAIQDQWRCCGYWSSASALGQVVPTETCISPEVAATKPACVDPFTDYTEAVLTNVSTFMYGIAGMLCLWVLVTSCVIAERKLQRRFRLIEAKQKERMGYV